MRVEVKKTRRAYEIGLESGLFRVPKVLDYDDNTGRVVLERIDGISLVDAKGNLGRSLIERTGRSLAVIHRMLSMPYTMVAALPSELCEPENEVFFHGDFNGMIVCTTPDSDVITTEQDLVAILG